MYLSLAACFSSWDLTLGRNLVIPCVCVVYDIHFLRETVFGHEKQFRVQQEGLNLQVAKISLS